LYDRAVRRGGAVVEPQQDGRPGAGASRTESTLIGRWLKLGRISVGARNTGCLPVATYTRQGSLLSIGADAGRRLAAVLSSATFPLE